MKYKIINKSLLKKYFKICNNGHFFELRYQKSINRIWIDKNFRFDENVASLAGLMPDGSLIRDLMRIYFHQKKDISKIYLFRDLIKNLFRPKNRIFIRKGHGAWDAYVNSQTLSVFFYRILGISKSDEPTRIPKWILASPRGVKIAYLRQAYDMEGTILKKLYEIRFITKDIEYAFDIKKLLKELGIGSIVRERIGGTHRTIQYRKCI